jgi:hypothetical protein
MFLIEQWDHVERAWVFLHKFDRFEGAIAQFTLLKGTTRKKIRLVQVFTTHTPLGEQS